MPHNSMLDLRKNTEKGSGIFATLNDKHPVDHRYKHNYLSQNERQNTDLGRNRTKSVSEYDTYLF